MLDGSTKYVQPPFEIDRSKIEFKNGIAIGFLIQNMNILPMNIFKLSLE